MCSCLLLPPSDHGWLLVLEHSWYSSIEIWRAAGVRASSSTTNNTKVAIGVDISIGRARGWSAAALPLARYRSENVHGAHTRRSTRRTAAASAGGAQGAHMHIQRHDHDQHHDEAFPARTASTRRRRRDARRGARRFCIFSNASGRFTRGRTPSGRLPVSTCAPGTRYPMKSRYETLVSRSSPPQVRSRRAQHARQCEKRSFYGNNHQNGARRGLLHTQAAHI